MRSKLLLLLTCSLSLYGSAQFPKQTNKFLIALQQQMTNTPSPAALEEAGKIHALFRFAQHRVGNNLCCYATPWVCCCPVGEPICMTATTICAIGACCMTDATFGCTDSLGFPLAESLIRTHKFRAPQIPTKRKSTK